LEDLAPRREALLPLRSFRKPGPKNSLFDGVYHGELVQFGDEPEPRPIQLGLQRQGDRVVGYYSFGVGSGFLEGEANGKDLQFEWKWAGSTGHGVFKARDDGSFTGTWGYRAANAGAGTWTGRRDP
jgi:hypothetical protein